MSVNNNKQAQQATKGKAEVGAKAPGFTLPTQAGTQVSLSDFIGKTRSYSTSIPRMIGHL
jgi:peroxiredoxin